MSDSPTALYGTEPGLRFAVVLDGTGGARALTWGELDLWRPEHGVLWMHLEREHPLTAHWLKTKSGIDPVLIEALIDEETRPRVETVGDGLLLVLRGIAAAPLGKESSVGLGCDFVPVHIWIDGDRMISVRDRDHMLMALRDIRNALCVGRGPRAIGELLVGMADKVAADLEPVVDAIDEAVDQLEDQLIDRDAAGLGSRLAPLRRRALHLRRYLAPQRDAVRRLQEEQPSWLTPHDQVLLREVLDKLLRHVEQLDSIRDRATILHEELTSLISERIARNSNRLAAVAALLLPPGTVAALFGMNLGGIPGTSNPYAFAIACAALAVLSLGIAALLRRLDWL